MSYIAFTDAKEAIESYFPGARPKEKLKTWGWSLIVDAWDFRIEVESLNQNVSARLMEAIEIPRHGRKFLTRESRFDIKTVGDLQVALVDFRATLLGVALTLLKFCGQNGGTDDQPRPPKAPIQG